MTYPPKNVKLFEVTSPAYDQFDDWFTVDPFQQAPELRIDWLNGVSHDADVLIYLRVLIRAIYNYPDPDTSDIKKFVIDEFAHCLKNGRFRIQPYMSGPRIVYETLIPEPDALRRLKELAESGFQPKQTPGVPLPDNGKQIWTGTNTHDKPTEPDAKKIDEVVAEPPPELDLDLSGPIQKVETALCYICSARPGEVNKDGVAICPSCKIIIKDEYA